MPTDDDAKTLADRAGFSGDVSLASGSPGAKVFGRYTLEKELGRGGMGVVWLARDEKVEVPVALKFLPDVVARDVESVNELKRELRRGLNLTHPGIVRVYSFEQDDQGAAISMEYVDGTTLGALKAKQPGGCFDWDDLLPWVEQLCAALDYAHEEAKIVHRDLKPRNLMITAKNRLKVADFGVATSISDTMTQATIRKDASGTPPYMSPQQAFGEDPTPSDDIYSLGATLYDLLTGRPPFYQGNVLAQVQQRVPPSMMERRAVLKVLDKKPIPEHWEKTIAACLAKNAEDRPQRASEVLDELKGLRQPPPVDTASMGPINPAVTLSSAGQEPLRRRRSAQERIDFETETPVRPPPLPHGEAWSPRKSGNPGLALAALVSILVVGGAIWWSQQGDENEGNAKLATSSDLPPSTPNAQVSTESTSDKKPPQTETGKEDPVSLAADAQAAAAGQIPTPGAAWTNGIYMKFIPVAGLAPLICEHEVRLIDYLTFALETKRPLLPTGFTQGDNHPVVNVSWNDAHAFCEWLTRRERSDGKLGSRQKYRLLSDAEWSAAAGVSAEQGRSPDEKDSNAESVYLWGLDFPPPAGIANLPGEGETVEGGTSEIAGYKDGFSHTSQVRHFPPNSSGLYDLAGNVAEWVEDWFNEERRERTIRGAAYVHFADREMLSSFRWHMKPDEAAEHIGFRVALELGGVAAPSVAAPTTPPIPVATPIPFPAPTPIPPR